MKNIAVIILLFFLQSCNSSYSVTADITIVISSVESQSDGTIAVSCKSESDSALYYYIGLESEIDGRWQEVIIDVSKAGDPKSARLLKIMPGEVRTTSFYPNDKLASFSKQLKRFRFKINFGTEVELVDRCLYSSAFELRKLSN